MQSSTAASGLGAPQLPREALFSEIYLSWFPKVLRWVKRLGGKDADAEDLAQEVFLVVHRRFDDFDGQNLGGWLYLITRRRVRDHRMLRWTQVTATCTEPSLIPFPKAQQSFLEARSELRALSRGLKALNPFEIEALLGLELAGMSGLELAQAQGASLNTIWSRVRRAREKLKVVTEPAINEPSARQQNWSPTTPDSSAPPL